MDNAFAILLVVVELCLGYEFDMLGRCSELVRAIFGLHLLRVWGMFGACLERVQNMLGVYLGDASGHV